MIKKILTLLYFFSFTFLSSQSLDSLLMQYLMRLDTFYIQTHLEFLAHDWLEGRESGEKGQYIAGLYLKTQLQLYGFDPLFLDSLKQKSYFQNFQISRTNPKKMFNVAGLLKGTDLAHEYIVLSAHYDHLGIGKQGVFHGADDNASGTSTLLEIARILGQLKKNGYPPRRSIILIFFAAEEKGLLGSEFFVENPPIPLQNIIADLNVDMVGRMDDKHLKENNPYYVYIIGSNFISEDLHAINEKMNQNYVNISLDYSYNSKHDKLRLYYRSDHYNFARNQIPVIFYFSGLHDDYHKVTDTYDKIMYHKTLKIAQLIFCTAFYLSYHEVTLKKNKDSD